MPISPLQFIISKLILKFLLILRNHRMCVARAVRSFESFRTFMARNGVLNKNLLDLTSRIKNINVTLLRLFFFLDGIFFWSNPKKLHLPLSAFLFSSLFLHFRKKACELRAQLCEAPLQPKKERKSISSLRFTILLRFKLCTSDSLQVLMNICTQFG